MKNIIAIAIMLNIFLLISGNVFSEGKRHALYARATVLPVLKYRVIHQERQLTITRADVERGYVDIDRATVLSVMTNSKNGYLMSFYIDGDQFNGLALRDENGIHTISGVDGEVHMPYQGNHYIKKELGFRFSLKADSTPGTYQWPVAVALRVM